MGVVAFSTAGGGRTCTAAVQHTGASWAVKSNSAGQVAEVIGGPEAEVSGIAKASLAASARGRHRLECRVGRTSSIERREPRVLLRSNVVRKALGEPQASD